MKKTVAILLAVVLVSFAVTPAMAAGNTGYTDVPANAWYAGAVEYCRSNGLMSGTSATTFAPNTTMTRAMLATVLYRAAGRPAVTGTTSFADVQPNTWYTDAVIWAHHEGVTSGYSNERFGTNDPVTREQIVTFLWRYAGSPTSAAGTDFADESRISSYAASAVDWARANNVIAGKGHNIFDPQGHATRAETAQILMNYTRLEPSEPDIPQPGDDPSILIAYFSWAGHTEQIARAIQEQTGGDLFVITPETPYTSNINELSGIALRELHENARPALGTHVANMSQYDVVFVGYPCWWSNAPMPVFTFLEEYDFAGKTIVPFTSYGENVFGNSITTMEQILTGSTILEGLAIQEHSIDTAPSRVSEWLQKLGLAK